MTTMGKYCKAYKLENLRAFTGWIEATENARKETHQGLDGKEVEAARLLTNADYLYVQENYVVTDSIFKDENIIFAQVTPGWIAYCRETLQFEIPAFASPATDLATSQT